MLTESGPRAIETLSAGTQVYSWNPKTGDWSLKPANKPLAYDYEGDIITIKAASAVVEATGNHPFWVVRGDDLKGRPDAKDVPEADRGMTERGRWVEARDLRSGDTLLAQGSEELTISRVSSRRQRLTVYNFTAGDSHTYAVH